MRRPSLLLVALLAGTVLLPGCVVNEGEKVDLSGQDVLLTLLHTSDTHSRLFPYELEVGEVDRQLGLVQDNGPFGGAARLAYLVKRERGRSGRSLWIDTGDPFQGAPIFNFFEGEAEFRVLSEIGVDVMVIGNHEFDRGGPNLAKQLDAWARFPALAANYRFEPSAYGENDLARLTRPYVTFNVQGLRVAVIGVGDTGSMFSIFETGNRLGITPLNVIDTVQQWVDFLRPQVDLIVVASHEGPSADEYIIRHTEGIDVVLGGHLHIVLDPPKTIPDCQDEGLQHPAAGSRRPACTPRPVILCHSGAFMKYLGRLDLVLRKNAADSRNGFEVASHEYTLYPVDSTVPEDPAVAYLLEPYALEMEQQIDLDRLIGYAPTTVRRFGSTGGDSPLGNLVADSMWLRRGIETDFSLSNTTGIRTDINPGPVTTEALFNVFPFDNTITTMFLSGLEVQDLFDYVARRTASRGCASQAQIAGARVVLNCRGCERTEGLPCAESVIIGDGTEARAIDPLGSYELATSNYLAQGGSGYVVLRRNTTQQDSGIPMREALIDRIRGGPPCADPRACENDGQCGDGETCHLPGRWRWNDTTTACDGTGAASGAGHCVLTACLTDVADMYMRRVLDDGDDPEQLACGFRDLAGAECAEVACVGAEVGALEDGRIRAYLP
ncbi:MAG: bifunctional metallophosphatase/5'-nucleotidase [Deltaproteobacteria bacterium]|nr:bifunctional metallophosphatase/5'-nucleotidase [Deltaproteobacteria bacterium]